LWSSNASEPRRTPPAQPRAPGLSSEDGHRQRTSHRTQPFILLRKEVDHDPLRATPLSCHAAHDALLGATYNAPSCGQRSPAGHAFPRRSQPRPYVIRHRGTAFMERSVTSPGAFAHSAVVIDLRKARPKKPHSDSAVGSRPWGRPCARQRRAARDRSGGNRSGGKTNPGSAHGLERVGDEAVGEAVGRGRAQVASRAVGDATTPTHIKSAARHLR
jgi:hypothetical protein